MGIIGKIKEGLHKFGVGGSVINIFEQKLHIRLPLPNKIRWRFSIKSELYFWDTYFKTKGLDSPEDFQQRLRPDLQLQEELVPLLPKGQRVVKILDVGAGPLTYIGKQYPGYELQIQATDPLAAEYDKLLDKYHIKAPVHTISADAEKLHDSFQENSFDIVHARNCIDHAYSPENAVLEMIRVTKPGSYVLLQHVPNEAVNQNWSGLHNWNFSEENGDFIISSKTMKINFSQKHAALFSIRTYMNAAKDWLYTEIRKK